MQPIRRTPTPSPQPPPQPTTYNSFVAPEDRVEFLAFFIETHFAATKARPAPTSVRVSGRAVVCWFLVCGGGFWTNGTRVPHTMETNPIQI